MKQMILFFSHELTKQQIEDAENNWNIDRFVSLPDLLQKKWSQIDPYSPEIDMQVFYDFLTNEAHPSDYILIQGEYGATWNLVNFAKTKGLIPIYATVARGDSFNEDAEGNSKSVIFKHCRFRRY